ncbi:hypothetical protein GCM10007389_11060 [Pontibacter akesuensis]|nr:hypothetical protein GCM10007389_11060 [Pontibacter akesuensis]
MASATGFVPKPKYNWFAAQGLCRIKEKGGAMSNPSVVLVSLGNNVHSNGELA